ncbi:hypothetical protein QTI51_37910 [Variovorax sp. J22G73]|uniref:hypothetical protein n=1 Tax=unclassified Variovorax TaxID=663243 RepID=UPI002576F786|nr:MULTISPECIES: hypothetical protein [unclassified Variovorax]MDM0010572.1 hypothetical protein [Variovorax sp. J22R203]MDM0103099.1 hypothetical protein [Variovorax sp. J22G73]
MNKPNDDVWPFPSSAPKPADEPVVPDSEESEAQSTDLGGKAGEDENAPGFVKQRKD